MTSPPSPLISLDVRFPGGSRVSVSVHPCTREGEVAVWTGNETGDRSETVDDHRHRRVRALLLGRDHQRYDTNGLSRGAVRILKREHVDEDDVEIGVLGWTSAGRTDLPSLGQQVLRAGFRHFERQDRAFFPVGSDELFRRRCGVVGSERDQQRDSACDVAGSLRHCHLRLAPKC